LRGRYIFWFKSLCFRIKSESRHPVLATERNAVSLTKRGSSDQTDKGAFGRVHLTR
jgi:hypothetical protein